MFSFDPYKSALPLLKHTESSRQLYSVCFCNTPRISYNSQKAKGQYMLASSSPMSSHNTTSTTNSFQLTYQDKGTLGLVISYPFDWKRIVATDKALIFLPPSKHDKFSESLVVLLFHIISMVVYRPVNYLVKLSISMDNIIANFQFFIQSHLSTMVIPSRYYYIHILTQSREKFLHWILELRMAIKPISFHILQSNQNILT